MAKARAIVRRFENAGAVKTRLLIGPAVRATMSPFAFVYGGDVTPSAGGWAAAVRRGALSCRSVVRACLALRWPTTTSTFRVETFYS